MKRSSSDQCPAGIISIAVIVAVAVSGCVPSWRAPQSNNKLFLMTRANSDTLGSLPERGSPMHLMMQIPVILWFPACLAMDVVSLPIAIPCTIYCARKGKEVHE